MTAAPEPSAAFDSCETRGTIEYDPGLIEETVLLALAGETAESAFRAERDAVYEYPGPEVRDRNFRAVHARWFVSLELDRPVAAALREQPSILPRVSRCACRLARRRKDEGAELYVSALDRSRLPALGIALLPDTLVGTGVLPFLRHELQHVADMLDPAFGYEPSLPATEAGPAYDRLVADRYRVLWDTSIDGRLVRDGRLPSVVHERRRREFASTFPMLAGKADSFFERFFRPESPLTHRQLVGFAVQPSAAPGGANGLCSLCRLPTRTFDSVPLVPHVVSEIRLRFPNFTPGMPVCGQCADLYRARGAMGAAGRGGAPRATANPCGE